MSARTLTIEFESDQEVEDAWVALLRAKATETTECVRLNRLVGGGYHDRTFSDPLYDEYQRVHERIRMLDKMLTVIKP